MGRSNGGHRGRWWLAAGLLGCLALAGCSGGSPGEAGDGKRFRIAVIPKGTSHDFWNSVRAGVEQAAKEFPELVVTWKGPVSEGDTNDQIDIVEQFLASEYDGVCLAPLDGIALRTSVDKAIERNVPVVIFDSGLKEMQGITSYVATNNYRGGQRAGEYLAKLLDGKGKYILIRYDLNSQSTDDRERGFLEAVSKFPGLEPLETGKYAGADETQAIALAENLLASHKDEVDGIFCPNQSTTSGVLTVLRRTGLAGKVKFVGFDSGESIVDGLEKGELHGAVLQDPVRMGYDAVRVMYDYLRGQQVPDRIETEEVLATFDNKHEKRVHDLLHPAAVR